jgi:superfamily II DNA or RNA helicase
MKVETGLSSLCLSDQYRTGESDPIGDFYNPCLSKACKYDRAVGYFRSSVYLLIGPSTIDFARRDGKIRMVCSPELDDSDSESITEGYEVRKSRLEKLILDEIDGLMAFDDMAYRLRILSTLVASGSLDIRLALRPKAKGLYHEKMGIFKDSHGNAVSFVGSANETWNGWHFAGNHEAIEVFRSWIGKSEARRVARHEANFDNLWHGRVSGVEIVPFPEAVRRKLIAKSLGSIEEVEIDRIGDFISLDSAKREKHDRPADLTVQPVRKTPLEHQTQALAAWREVGHRGILEHATGSGKTFTAIIAIREHLEAGGPVLILVPSRLLLEQWKTELEAEIPDAVLIVAGGGHTRWRQHNRLASMTMAGSFDQKRITLSTMQTAGTRAFMGGVRGGPHLMIVADEVHQCGSTHNSKIFEIDTGSQLGLSATPERYGDPDGTEKMFAYFGPIVPPPFTLNDAIRSKRLVEYEYHPHLIHLTTEEAEEWKRLTLRIVREIVGKTDDAPRPLSDKAKMLLIQRSRIAKKASAKIGLSADVLSNVYKKGQRWLVYCEDGEHLAHTMEALREKGFSPIEYHTGMEGSMTDALEYFRTFGGILVSIRCLDEGVDIPTVDHALILASSQNPRQFIQRRGRVLRTAPGKHLAVIHDALVVPISLKDEPDQLALLKCELARAIEFADSALNKNAGAEIRGIATSLGFDPEKLREVGIEEEIAE